MDIQVQKNHYFNQKYNHGARWLSYWHQIDLILKIRICEVLEVGVGAGIVRDYLQKAGILIKTLDIDPALKPDVIGSIDAMPVEDKGVDCVLAAEVLEHLPYEKFGVCLNEMARVAKKYAVISIPDSRRTLCNFYLKIPFLPVINFFAKIMSGKIHKFDGQHYWELGKQNYSIKTIRHDIIKNGWTILREFTPQDVPTKRFYLLKICQQ